MLGYYGSFSELNLIMIGRNFLVVGTWSLALMIVHIIHLEILQIQMQDECCRRSPEMSGTIFRHFPADQQPTWSSLFCMRNLT